MVTQVAKTKKEAYEDARLAKAIASVEVIEEWHTCKVASTSNPDAFYFVDYDKHFYAVSCECEAAQHNMDCVHRLAVDRYFDDVRPSFHEMAGTASMVRGLAWFRQQCQVAEEASVESVAQEREVVSPAIVTVGEVMTAASEAIVEHIESVAVEGDVSYVQAIEKSLDATYAELAAVKAANKEREERETAKAWREYHDMPY